MSKHSDVHNAGRVASLCAGLANGGAIAPLVEALGPPSSASSASASPSPSGAKAFSLRSPAIRGSGGGGGRVCHLSIFELFRVDISSDFRY